MTHFDASCAVCQSLRGERAARPLFENELWHVRHGSEPAGVAGWMMLISQRHVASPAQFDDREASSLGPTLRQLQRALLEVTGAERIYLAAMGESSPHFHCHLVPRYAKTPGDVKAWGLFDLQRRAAAGEIVVPSSEVERVSLAYAAALRQTPPP